MSRNVKSVNRALGFTSKPGRPSSITTGDGLENVIAGMGTDRDKRSYTQYALPKLLTQFDLNNMFRGSWLAKKIVTSVPNDITRKWRRFVLPDEDNNPQLDSLKQAEKDFKIVDKFKEAMYWARLYGGSIMILGLKDVSTTADMMKPLKVESVRQGDLKYVHVLDRWRCAASGKIDYDLSSPNFGKPLSYVIAESSVEVHWTRIIRFDGQKLPYIPWMGNGMWDDSELQHVVESLMNYDTSTSAIASMLFEANIDVVSSQGLSNLLSTKDGEAKVVRRFQLGQLMKSYNRTLILDADETYEKKQNQFTNIDKIWQQFMVDVSGASGIAVSILFGVQSGGLDSGGDDDKLNYYDFVASERTAKCDPQLDYFDQIFVRSIIGIFPDDYKSEWEPLWQIDDSERSTIEYQDAQRDQIYLGSGVVTEGLVASQLKAKGTYQTMSDEDVELAEELGESMDEHDDVTRQQQQESGEIANKAAKKDINNTKSTNKNKLGGKNAK